MYIYIYIYICIYIYTSFYIRSKEKGLESDKLNGSVHEVTRYTKIHLFYLKKDGILNRVNYVNLINM
jgi:hypothetical protein